MYRSYADCQVLKSVSLSFFLNTLGLLLKLSTNLCRPPSWSAHVSWSVHKHSRYQKGEYAHHLSSCFFYFCFIFFYFDFQLFFTTHPPTISKERQNFKMLTFRTAPCISTLCHVAHIASTHSRQPSLLFAVTLTSFHEIHPARVLSASTIFHPFHFLHFKKCPWIPRPQKLPTTHLVFSPMWRPC